MAEPEASASSSSDPAPLGWAAFALTMFLWSASNAALTRGPATSWVTYATVYGGVVLILAGMWEFRSNNTFGAMAFSSYGAMWLGMALGAKSGNALGWTMLAFFIFTCTMLLASTRLSMGITGFLLLLAITQLVVM